MALAYKKNFSSTPALQLFYTGGTVRLSPDGSYVACACGEDVKCIDLDSGLLTKTIPCNADLVTSFVISPNGKAIFVATRSFQVQHWDIATTTLKRTWKAHDGPIPDMDVDASGGVLATGSADKTVRVWDIDGGFCTHSFKGHKGVVTKVKFHKNPHHLLLFSGGDDCTVRIWDLVSKLCIASLDKHFSAITSLAVSPNGWSLLTGGRDKVVNIWSLRDYKHEATVPVYEAIEAVCVIPDGCELPGSGEAGTSLKKSRFLTVGELGIVRVFSADGAKCLYKQEKSDVSEAIQKDEKRGFVDAFLLPGAKGVLCVTVDHRLLFYEPIKRDDGKRDLRVNKRLIGYSDEITDLRFIGEHETMLAVASNVEQVRLYDTTTMTCTQELTGHSDIVLCLDSTISPGGKPILASAGKDHTLRVWDVESGSCVAMASGHMGAVGALAFSKKNRNFVVTGSKDRTIKLWGLENVLDNGVLENPVKLSSQAVVAAHDKDINSVAVAPNDSLICSGSQDATARVWKLPELSPVFTLRGHKRGVWSVEFSPVDLCVVTSSGDKTIRIWSLSDGSCLKTFEGHTASVLKASFLSHGTQIISAGADGLLKLWTIRSNECINTFDQHTDKIWALTVAPRSERLASGGSDSTVMLWTDCTVADEEEAAMKEAEEVLKDQELANALADTDYEKAIQLAFELRRPYKLLNVFTELFKAGGDAHIRTVVEKLDKEYLQLLFQYIREWNSKSKFCYVAQCVLQNVFAVFPPAELTQISGVTELLEGILPYTQRHFNRIDRLARSCFVLDYTLSCMSVLTPMETPKLVVDSRSFQPVGMQSYWNQEAQLVDAGDTNGAVASGDQHLLAEGPMVSEVEEKLTAVEDDHAIPSRSESKRPKKKKRQNDDVDDASVREDGGNEGKKRRKLKSSSRAEADVQDGARLNDGVPTDAKQDRPNGTSVGSLSCKKSNSGTVDGGTGHEVDGTGDGVANLDQTPRVLGSAGRKRKNKGGVSITRET